MQAGSPEHEMEATHLQQHSRGTPRPPVKARTGFRGARTRRRPAPALTHPAVRKKADSKRGGTMLEAKPTGCAHKQPPAGRCGALTCLEAGESHPAGVARKSRARVPYTRGRRLGDGVAAVMAHRKGSRAGLGGGLRKGRQRPGERPCEDICRQCASPLAALRGRRKTGTISSGGGRERTAEIKRVSRANGRGGAPAREAREGTSGGWGRGRGEGWAWAWDCG